VQALQLWGYLFGVALGEKRRESGDRIQEIGEEDEEDTGKELSGFNRLAEGPSICIIGISIQ
jgi:hypothetical protein